MLYCEGPEASRSLRLDVYQRRARWADQNRRVGAEGLKAPLLGLFGETGSLLTQLKRTQREKATYSPYYASVVEEMGDVLWYLSNTASRQRVRLSALARLQIANEAPKSLSFAPRPSLTFGELQRRRRRYAERVTRLSEEDFFALGAVVGRLINDFSGGEDQPLGRLDILMHLARILRALVRAASSAGVSMTLVANNNLAKTRSRWPKKNRRVYLEPFDKSFKKDEQLPRRIVMYFEEKRINGKTYVFQQCRGINIGDRLTDNKMEKDDYRFHDVFHLAYAAILGWSPVTRALFQVKRKSDPDIDENQDGARAILIEEGIATWIFNHGSGHKDFRLTSNLDYSLLKAIRQFALGYEVDQCPLWQWQLAILEGFKVFRRLKKQRRGWVIVDMKRHSITYRRTPPNDR